MNPQQILALCKVDPAVPTGMPPPIEPLSHAPDPAKPTDRPPVCAPVPTKEPRACCHCTNKYRPRISDQKYCSKACRIAARDTSRQLSSQLKERGVPPGTVGAIAELAVCADLLRRGYAVFRAMSPASPCDLVVLYGQQLFSVEVRTGYRWGTNDAYAITKRAHVATILAVVIHGDAGTAEIIYEPPLPGGGYVNAKLSRVSAASISLGTQN